MNKLNQPNLVVDKRKKKQKETMFENILVSTHTHICVITQKKNLKFHKYNKDTPTCSYV